MAVLVHNQGADWTQELYQTVFDRTIPDRTNLPVGLISHVATPLGDGGWQVIEVWESAADHQRFLEDVIIPAAQELGAPPVDAKVYEIHNLLLA